MADSCYEPCGYFQERGEAIWEILVRMVFGAFMDGLVLLLILLYYGVPIVWPR